MTLAARGLIMSIVLPVAGKTGATSFVPRVRRVRVGAEVVAVMGLYAVAQSSILSCFGYCQVAATAQGDVLIVTDKGLRGATGGVSVREHGIAPRAPLTPRMKLGDGRTMGDQVENAPELLPPKVTIESSDMDLFAIIIDH